MPDEHASQAQEQVTAKKEEPKTEKLQSGGSWLTRGFGLLQAGAGVLEMAGGVVGGVLTSETGIGAVAGGVVALHGVDDFRAGLRTAFSKNQPKPLRRPRPRMRQNRSAQARLWRPASALALISLPAELLAAARRRRSEEGDRSSETKWFTAPGNMNSKLLKLLNEHRAFFVSQNQGLWKSCTFTVDVGKHRFAIDLNYD